MTQTDVDSPKPTRTPIPPSDIDLILSVQLIVGWAGESGEEPRLGWWRTDMVSEFGGEDLFRRLLPNTWPWAVLQSAREAARRLDASQRSPLHNPDQVISLFRFGFDIDEAVDERLHNLKRSGRPPATALPGLAESISETWNQDLFANWVDGHGQTKHTIAPIGRQLPGAPPGDTQRLVKQLVAGLAPLADAYPLPHYRRPR